MTAVNTRLSVTYVLYDVIASGRSLSSALNEQLNEISNPPDRGLTQEIVLGTLRNYRSLQMTLRPFLKKAIPDKNKPLEIVLCSALYQLLILKLPSYAVINESVNATKAIDFEWAKGFVNGVLRAVVREPGLALLRDSDCDHPYWLAECIRKAYPENYEAIFENNHYPARVMLRVRSKYCSRDAYLKLLHAESIDAVPHVDNKDAVILQGHANVSRLPYFQEGYVTVQDANAQLAANLLGVRPGMRVLDACAAPGGKTAHIADKAGGASIVAIDNVPERLVKLNETLERLGVSVQVIESDVRDVDNWHDGELFDRILLDVPCSATGVVRKHPDILFHRRQSDIRVLLEIQKELLDICWKLLKPKGRLLYATCSILPAENDGQIKDFLAKSPSASLCQLGHNRAIKSNQIGLQFLPDDYGDGFFYALLEKGA